MRVKNNTVFQFMTIILTVALLVFFVPEIPTESASAVVIAILFTSIAALLSLQYRRRKFLKKFKKRGQ